MTRLAATLPVAVIATDVSGVVRVWSEVAETIYGWTAEETVGRHIADLTVHPVDVGVANQIMAQVSRGQPWAGRYHARTETARRLHDDVGQVMAMLKMEIEGMRNHDGLAAVVRSRLDRLGGDLDLAIRSVRDLTDELPLRSFDVWNLVIRLFELSDDVNRRGWAFADCSVGVEVEQLRHVAPEVAYAAYNVAREAIFNSMRHSSCNSVVLRLEVVAGRLVLEVTDNGVGIAGSVAGHGRTSMLDRVSAVGGLFEMLDRSRIGASGTAVRASFAPF